MCKTKANHTNDLNEGEDPQNKKKSLLNLFQVRITKMKCT